MRLNYASQFVETFEPGLLFGAVTDTGFEHRLLTGGAFQGHLHRVSLPNCRLDSGCYSLPCFTRGSAPRGWIMLGMTNCRETPVWVNGHDAFSNHLQVYAEDAPIDYRTTSNASWYAIQVRRDWIQSLALTLVGRELELPARGCLNLSVSIARAWALREEMDSILKLGQRALSAHAFATTSPRIESSLMEKVIGALMQDAPRKTLLPRAIRHRCDIVKRIEHALDERQAEPFRIQRLIAQTGLKERTLQRFCQEVYGLTPRQLFGVARLNRIRQQLQSRERPTSTIRSLATASGVNHLGRFAAEYRKLFGEHPRDTLQRARYQSHPLLPR